MAAKNAAQVAKNTTAYPKSSVGGGPTYTKYVPPPVPSYTPPPQYQQPQYDPPEYYDPPQPEEAQPQPGPVAQALAAQPQQTSFETDPGYLSALAAEQAGSQQLDAALRAFQERAIVQFGDPSLAGTAGFDLDPLTAAMAQQNTQSGNSTLAQLQQQRDMNQQGILNQLAAHGMIQSGDLGYKTGQNEQNYGHSLYGAQQSVLDSLAQQGANTASQKQGLRGNTTNALTNAYRTFVGSPQFWGAANDGGSVSAANTVAIQPVAPPQLPSGYGTPKPVSSSFSTPGTPSKVPASRLAKTPVSTAANRYQVARNSY